MASTVLGLWWRGMRCSHKWSNLTLMLGLALMLELSEANMRVQPSASISCYHYSHLKLRWLSYWDHPHGFFSPLTPYIPNFPSVLITTGTDTSTSPDIAVHREGRHIYPYKLHSCPLSWGGRFHSLRSSRPDTCLKNFKAFFFFSSLLPVSIENYLGTWDITALSLFGEYIFFWMPLGLNFALSDVLLLIQVGVSYTEALLRGVKSCKSSFYSFLKLSLYWSFLYTEAHESCHLMPARALMANAPLTALQGKSHRFLSFI